MGQAWPAECRTSAGRGVYRQLESVTPVVCPVGGVGVQTVGLMSLNSQVPVPHGSMHFCPDLR